MSTQTFNLPFSFEHNSDNGFSYIRTAADLSCYAASVSLAKMKLRPALAKKIKELFTAEENYERRVMGCQSGEVLIVSYRHNSWGYDIAGDGRTHCASCIGFESFSMACERARDHAAQVWGGIKWEC